VEQNPVTSDSRHEFRLGLWLVAASLAWMGAASHAPGYIAVPFVPLAVIATVVLLAKTVNAVMEGRSARPDHVKPKLAKAKLRRVQFGLGTLLVTVTVAAAFLGLSIWNRSYYCTVVYDGYVYGFPFPCINVPNSMASVGVDFRWAAADSAVAVALVVGVAMELERLACHRGRKDAEGKFTDARDAAPADPKSTSPPDGADTME